MKSLIFSFAIIIMAGCGETVVKNYYCDCASNSDNDTQNVDEESINDQDEILDDYAVEIEETPDEDGFVFEKDAPTIDDLDQQENEADTDFVVITENELDADNTDSVDLMDENILIPDEDFFVDFCVQMIDNQEIQIDGDYSDGSNRGNTKTVLTISLLSQDSKYNCLVTLHSISFSVLNNLSFEATSTPVKKLPVTCQSTACYLYLDFLNPNVLAIRLFNASTLDAIFDHTFLRK